MGKSIEYITFTVPDINFDDPKAIDKIVLFKLSSLKKDYEVLDVETSKNSDGKFNFKVKIKI